MEEDSINVLSGETGEWGYGGVRLEEMVLVTETGNRVLSNWPSGEIIPVASVLG